MNNKNSPDQEIAYRIKKLINNSELSASTILSELDIAKGAIYNWEHRSIPNSDAIIKLANYFGVSTDYLLLGKEKDEDRIILSSSEKELLSLFNQLNESDKNTILKAIKGILDN